MKATGIVRRVDDLGRIVVPKEMRKVLRVKDGDPMEITLDGDRIILRPWDVSIEGQLRAILQYFEGDAWGPGEVEALEKIKEIIKDLAKANKKAPDGRPSEQGAHTKS